MKDLKNTSMVELIQQMTYLERRIDTELLQYNKIVKELYERIPTLENQSEIKPKMLVKTKIDI